MTDKIHEQKIGIGGGVGPMAGVGLHQKVIENTLTNGTDQDHFGVLHASRAHDIADRTKFLLEGGENPAEGMARTAHAIEQAAKKAWEESSKEASGDECVVFGVPCNTFHAPQIFDRFLELVKDKKMKMKVIHMLEETGDLIKQMLPDAKKIGLMSTTGTRSVGVYNQILEPRGFEITEVPEEMQEELHETIYNPEWGIKAVSPVTQQARENFLKYVEVLRAQGADAVILGCTEIPLALPEKDVEGTPLVDPVDALARALIRETDAKKLKPLN